MKQIALTGLLRIELPDRTLRYCDGGFFKFNGETYRSFDDVFGTVGTVEAVKEGIGDIVPAVNMTLLIPDASGVADVSKPGNQKSRVVFTIAEYDVETGLIQSSNKQFDGQLDQTVFVISRDRKELGITVVSLAERLFEGNIGNTLNSTFHKSVWPGEKGHDNATGLTVDVAWGVESPRRNGGGGGGFRGVIEDMTRMISS